MNKICIVCGTEFTRKVGGRGNISLGNWNNLKSCSVKCKKVLMSRAKIGKIPWNKGIPMDDDIRDNLRRNYSRKMHGTEQSKKAIATRKARYGYINSPETKVKIRLANLGPKSHFWKGGLSKENYRLRRTARYQKWRKAVFERDDYTCQKCHARGVELHPHHIKSWEKYPELRFEISNGKTLCIPCHKQTDSYAKNFR